MAKASDLVAFWAGASYVSLTGATRTVALPSATLFVRFLARSRVDSRTTSRVVNCSPGAPYELLANSREQECEQCQIQREQ